MTACDLPGCCSTWTRTGAIKRPGWRMPERVHLCQPHYDAAHREGMLVDYLSGKPIPPPGKPFTVPMMPPVPAEAGPSRSFKALRQVGPPPKGWPSWSDWTLALIYGYQPIERARVTASLGPTSPHRLIDRMIRERWVQYESDQRLSLTEEGTKRARIALGEVGL